MYKLIDLFCGCGGMSWGLPKKSFESIAAFDIWDVALNTYKLNHPQSKIYCKDLSKVDPLNIMTELKLHIGELDLLIGGPPCQDFSKNVPATGRFLDDERNQLYLSYLNFVETPNAKSSNN